MQVEVKGSTWRGQKKNKKNSVVRKKIQKGKTLQIQIQNVNLKMP